MMNTKEQLSLIVESDSNKTKISTLRIAPKHKDSNHLQRRQQQRAINNTMIQVALMYGRKHHYKGAVIYTLTDRILRQTPYFRFTDTLRGLRVVCQNQLPEFQLLTAYWHEETKRRVRK
jgi:hypothetical protein